MKSPRTVEAHTKKTNETSGRKPGWLRRVTAAAAAANLKAFVIPDLEYAQSFGFDLKAASLKSVANPRHANVLLIMGELPPGLIDAAQVVYAQMLQPKVILSLGKQQISPLPLYYLAAEPSQAGLANGVEKLRQMVTAGVWSSEVPSLTGFPEDHQKSRHEKPEGEKHNGTPESEPDSNEMDHSQMDHSKMSMDMGGMDHSQMDMGGMDMDMSGGFMSMVAMTKDLPRSRDGLPMERVETPFGPFFKGLPGGLGLHFTLDGDVVAKAKINQNTLGRHLEQEWVGKALDLPDKLAHLNPLTPVAYKVLAQKALENAFGSAVPVDEPLAYHRIALLELERMSSHLALLARMFYLIGAQFLYDSASALLINLAQTKTADAFLENGPQLTKLDRAISRTPYLKSRLRNKAALSPDAVKILEGSVSARANGVALDARLSDPFYKKLCFKPVLHTQGDALARFEVYLAEIKQGFEIAGSAISHLEQVKDKESTKVHLPTFSQEFPLPFSLDVTGLPLPEVANGAGAKTGAAKIETPHGTASLELVIEKGQVSQIRLDTPSKRLAGLISQVAEGQDLADALVGVASLNLSPWELDY